MQARDQPLSHNEFWSIYSKVPRLTVEIVLRKSAEVYLTKRSIEPCKGFWHLPGGTVRFAEPLTEAVKRIASRELGITVLKTKMLGYIEYPSHYLNGLDSPVGIAFSVESYDGSLRLNADASNGGWFNKLPRPMHKEQCDFIENKVIY